MKYSVFILLVLLIIFRYFSIKPVYKEGDYVRVTTTIYSDPVVRGVYQTFNAAGLKITLPSYPEINYGDRVVMEGKISGNKLINTKLVSIDSFNGLFSDFRQKIISLYLRLLPQPMSGLTAGITLGSKGAISPDFWENVKNTGVAHVVVASGTNITFVVSFIFGVVVVFVSRRKAIPIVILSILLYLIISGFQAPLVRAAIMAGLAFWAEVQGRLLAAWRNLLLTAFIMLAIDPSWLTDLGFMLSFVSTASIIVFEKRISKILKFMPTIIKEGFSSSFAAQIGVAPILFITFGQFNPLSPLINALVLWTVPFIMILASIAGIIGLVVPLVGQLILYVSYPLTWWFVKVVGLFS